MTKSCDFCGTSEYTNENPFVRLCQRRPSDKSDMCCVMWGHWRCTGNSGPYVAQLPTMEHDLGYAVATYTDLETWIESETAQKLGYLFIT